LLVLGGIAGAWAVSVAWLHLAPVQRQFHQGEALVGGPFALVSHTGGPISDADFRGRPMLVTFGYARNPTDVSDAAGDERGARPPRPLPIASRDPDHVDPARQSS
jgi:protein SCO1/2